MMSRPRTSTMRIHAFLLAALVLGCPPASERKMEGTVANLDPMFQRFTSLYLATVRASRGSGFRTLPLKPPVDRAVLISMDWCNRVFRVPIHPADDSVKHRYRVAQAK